MTHDAFQQQVISDLSELKTNMASLIGNGQPGRIGSLEREVKNHSKIINRVIGALIVINFLFGAGIVWRVLS